MSVCVCVCARARARVCARARAVCVRVECVCVRRARVRKRARPISISHRQAGITGAPAAAARRVCTVVELAIRTAAYSGRLRRSYRALLRGLPALPPLERSTAHPGLPVSDPASSGGDSGEADGRTGEGRSRYDKLKRGGDTRLRR